MSFRTFTSQVPEASCTCMKSLFCVRRISTGIRDSATGSSPSSRKLAWDASSDSDSSIWVSFALIGRTLEGLTRAWALLVISTIKNLCLPLYRACLLSMFNAPLVPQQRDTRGSEERPRGCFLADRVTFVWETFVNTLAGKKWAGKLQCTLHFYTKDILLTY